MVAAIALPLRWRSTPTRVLWTRSHRRLSRQTRGAEVIVPHRRQPLARQLCLRLRRSWRLARRRAMDQSDAERDRRFSAARRTSSGATPSSPSWGSGGAPRGRACDRSGSSSGNLGLARRRWSMRLSHRSRPRRTSQWGAVNASMTMGWAKPIVLCWRRWAACAGTRKAIASWPPCASMLRAGWRTCHRCSIRPTEPRSSARLAASPQRRCCGS